jgi:hypothetical protein
MKASDYVKEGASSESESTVGKMSRYYYEGVYQITVPIEVTAYSQDDALERILRRDLSVIAYDSTHTNYDIVCIRCVEE